MPIKNAIHTWAMMSMPTAHPHWTQLLAGCWRDRGAGCYHWGSYGDRCGKRCNKGHSC